MNKPSTQTADYAFRLARLQGAGLRRWIDVQAPYRYHLRRLALGFTLDIGAGIGRNLLHLGKEGVGVDHNEEGVRQMKERGLVAYTPAGFSESPYARAGRFDSLLLAHVIEHMTIEEAKSLIAHYLPFLKKGGQVVLITPQPAGFRSDPTHTTFIDGAASAELLKGQGLAIRKNYSFPFPRWVGHFFPHNEFVVVAEK